MLPGILEGAPEWAAGVFWVLVAIGAAAFILRNMFLGAKDEARTIRSTGKPTSSQEIAQDAATNFAARTLTMTTIGGGIIERQIAEDHIQVGKQLVEELESLRAELKSLHSAVANTSVSAALIRLAVVYEKRVEIDEREEHRLEVEEAARKLAERMVADRDRDRR